jgi:hypothetical protein
LICPRHGTDDLAFRPVGLAIMTAMPASTASTRAIQKRDGTGYSS